MGRWYKWARETTELVGYQYEAELHCLDCAALRFGPAVYGLDFEAEDNEGNPVHPITLGELEGGESCGDCLEYIDTGYEPPVEPDTCLVCGDATHLNDDGVVCCDGCGEFIGACTCAEEDED